jgi:diadenosine tetraphosphate (Ap4A) HIT family hydrolase
MSQPQDVSRDYDERCPFCRIARSSDPSAVVVAEGLNWLAFFPDAPATPGHTLVVPRRHVAHFWALDDELATALSVACLRVGRAIHETLDPEGMNLITSQGAAAEQTVMHVHMHLVPRWPDDAVGEIWPPKQPPDSAMLADVALRIRAALRDN